MGNREIGLVLRDPHLVAELQAALQAAGCRVIVASLPAVKALLRGLRQWGASFPSRDTAFEIADPDGAREVFTLLF